MIEPADRHFTLADSSESDSVIHINHYALPDKVGQVYALPPKRPNSRANSVFTASTSTATTSSSQSFYAAQSSSNTLSSLPEASSARLGESAKAHLKPAPVEEAFARMPITVEDLSQWNFTPPYHELVKSWFAALVRKKKAVHLLALAQKDIENFEDAFAAIIGSELVDEYHEAYYPREDTDTALGKFMEEVSRVDLRRHQFIHGIGDIFGASWVNISA